MQIWAVIELFFCFSLASCFPLLQDADIQYKFTILCDSLNRKGMFNYYIS